MNEFRRSMAKQFEKKYIISIKKCKFKYHFHLLDWKDLKH